MQQSLSEGGAKQALCSTEVVPSTPETETLSWAASRYLTLPQSHYACPTWDSKRLSLWRELCMASLAMKRNKDMFTFSDERYCPTHIFPIAGRI